MPSPEETPTATDPAIVKAVRDALATGELRDIVVAAAVESFNSGDLTFTPKEAAAALGCGVRFLLDGCNKHGFPYIDMGKSKRFGPQELREIRNMLRVPAKPSRLAAARRRSAAEKGPDKPTGRRQKPADGRPLELALTG
ncbi:hypothetical protein OIU91_06395 [Streptomyces sp. NBC_01456]|uniref:hypothetical protein n=1 Tax=unclassified Streptomyces TaxID=2593676 RepID=UPI002E2ECF5A|nr:MULTISPECIES: hypothetical protein [unclassified Streptomyces]